MRPAFFLARAGPVPPSAVGDGASSSKKKDGGGAGSSGSAGNKPLPRLHRLPSPSSSPSRASNRSRAAGLTASPEPSKEASSVTSQQQQQQQPAPAVTASKSAAAFAYAQGLFSKFRGNENVRREKKRGKKECLLDRGALRPPFGLFVAQPQREYRICLYRAGRAGRKRRGRRAASVPCSCPKREKTAMTQRLSKAFIGRRFKVWCCLPAGRNATRRETFLTLFLVHCGLDDAHDASRGLESKFKSENGT